VKEDGRSSARHGYMIQGNPGTTLLDAARLTATPASWATPVATEIGNTLENYTAMKRNMKSGPRTAITHPSLQAQLTAPPAPKPTTAMHGNWYEEQLPLPAVESASSNQEIGSGSPMTPPGEDPSEVTGPKTSNGSTAGRRRGTKTGASGQLDPELSSWLMGLPPSWLKLAPRD
jgi:hypothetical protein